MRSFAKLIVCAVAVATAGAADPKKAGKAAPTGLVTVESLTAFASSTWTLTKDVTCFAAGNAKTKIESMIPKEQRDLIAEKAALGMKLYEEHVAPVKHQLCSEICGLLKALVPKIAEIRGIVDATLQETVTRAVVNFESRYPTSKGAISTNPTSAILTLLVCFVAIMKVLCCIRCFLCCTICRFCCKRKCTKGACGPAKCAPKATPAKKNK